MEFTQDQITQNQRAERILRSLWNINYKQGLSSARDLLYLRNSPDLSPTARDLKTLITPFTFLEVEKQLRLEYRVNNEDEDPRDRRGRMETTQRELEFLRGNQNNLTLSYTSLANFDLRRVFFENIMFLNISFENASFSFAHCVGVRFFNCNMRNTKFIASRFSRCYFINCDLDGAQFLINRYSERNIIFQNNQNNSQPQITVSENAPNLPDYLQRQRQINEWDADEDNGNVIFERGDAPPLPPAFVENVPENPLLASYDDIRDRAYRENRNLDEPEFQQELLQLLGFAPNDEIIADFIEEDRRRAQRRREEQAEEDRRVQNELELQRRRRLREGETEGNVAMEVHEVFRLVDFEDILKVIGNIKNYRRNSVPFGDYFVTWLENKITSETPSENKNKRSRQEPFFSEEEREVNMQKLHTLKNRITSSDMKPILRNYYVTLDSGREIKYQDFINTIIGFVNNQPIPYQQNYIKYFLNDSCDAYGEGGVSCIAGIAERMITSVGAGVGLNNSNYDILANATRPYPDEISHMLRLCYDKFIIENEERPGEINEKREKYKKLNIDERKQLLLECTINKLPEGKIRPSNRVREFIKKQVDESTGILGDDMMLGGKRKKRQQKKSRKKRKTRRRKHRYTRRG